jgi:phenylalanyl-tRNA synthetase beta chain
LHAFDADTLGGKEIIVRRADLDEKITTLDGVERELNPSMLVIADAHQAVAVAGVMGGAETRNQRKPPNVLLESANFDPLRSEKLRARSVFSAKPPIDSNAALTSRWRATLAIARPLTIQALAGGTVLSRVIDVYPSPQAYHRNLRRNRIAFLGAPLKIPSSNGFCNDSASNHQDARWLDR